MTERGGSKISLTKDETSVVNVAARLAFPC